MVRQSRPYVGRTQSYHFCWMALCHPLLRQHAHLRLHLRKRHPKLLFLLRRFLYLPLLHSRRHRRQTSQKNQIQLTLRTVIRSRLRFLLHNVLHFGHMSSRQVRDYRSFRHLYSLPSRLLDLQLDLIQHRSSTNKRRTIRRNRSRISMCNNPHNHRNIRPKVLANHIINLYARKPRTISPLVLWPQNRHVRRILCRLPTLPHSHLLDPQNNDINQKT